MRSIRTHRSDTSTGAGDEHGLTDQTGGVEYRHSAARKDCLDDASMYLQGLRKEGEPWGH